MPPKLFPDTCEIPGCGRQLEARGLCALHYMRWRKRGSTELTSLSAEDRFWAKVAPHDEADCWNWTGAHSEQGHGNFWSGTGYTKAYRFSWELIHGPIPEGLTVDHLCRNPPCVNPAHMELVTLAENLHRGTGFAGVNFRKTECIHGHPYTPENTYIDARGSRTCKVCRVASSDKERAKRRKT